MKVGRLRKQMAKLLNEQVGMPVRAEDITLAQGAHRSLDVYRWHVLTDESVPSEFYSWDTLTDCVRGFTIGDDGEVTALLAC